MNVAEVARKNIQATGYKFLVYWILKARNVGMNQTRWRSPIFHSTGPRRISATSRFISRNSTVRSLARQRDHTDGKSGGKRQANDCFFQRGTRRFSVKHATWRYGVSRCVHKNVPSIKYRNLFSREKKTLAHTPNRGPQLVFRVVSSIMRYDEEGNFVRNILSSCFSQAQNAVISTVHHNAGAFY